MGGCVGEGVRALVLVGQRVPGGSLWVRMGPGGGLQGPGGLQWDPGEGSLTGDGLWHIRDGDLMWVRGSEGGALWVRGT